MNKPRIRSKQRARWFVLQVGEHLGADVRFIVY